MKNYLLTDFNTERWNGINMESVKAQVEKLNEKINKIGCMFGEIGNPETYLKDGMQVPLLPVLRDKQHVSEHVLGSSWHDC